MEKIKFKDVAHLYLGCTFIGKYKNWEYDNHPMMLCLIDLTEGRYEYIKPILRSLNDMTSQEKEYIISLWNNSNKLNIPDSLGENLLPHNIRPDIFLWLLSKHFDLFNLIPNQEAIQQP